MLRYVARRLILAALTVLFVSFVVFALMRLMPGDPVQLQQGSDATTEAIAAARREMGLDRPLPLQYVHWLQHLAMLDPGRSFLTSISIADELQTRIPVSLQLMVLTMIWTVALGIPFGIISAVRRNQSLDYIVRFFAVIGLAVPSFWIATLVIILPAQFWGYSPPLDRTVQFVDAPWTNMRQFIPPSLVLALAPVAGVMRLMRSSILETTRQDYIRTAHAKGLPERMVLYRHALKNSLIPVVTVMGLQVANLLSGSVVVEQVFNLRGVGQYLYTSILQKDYLVAQNLVLYVAATVVGMNLLVDILYSYLDPRIRYE